MSLYKRGKTYYIKLTHPRTGETVRVSTRTGDRREAQRIHDCYKARLWAEVTSDRVPRSWEEAVVRWLTERADKSSIRMDRSHLRWLDPHLRGVQLHEITRDMVESIVATKQASPSTRNRIRALIRAILTAAWKEWEWIDRVPAIRMEREPDRRVRFLTRTQFERLVSLLPEHLGQMARFAVATGLRRSNITGLTWDRVDLNRRCAWVEAGDTKNGESLGVYLNEEARKVLEARKGIHPKYVFTFRGKPIEQTSTKAWYKALKKAGIEGFRWHDLRHTWASWHAQKGTPLFAIQEAGGWKSPQMVRRYAHLSAEHFEPYGEQIVGTK